jgi:PAS domain S-box-containing protein
MSVVSQIEIPIEPLEGLDPRFCEVMDAAPVMIWVSDNDKRCVWFNRPWLAFTGRAMSQEVGNGWAEGVHPADFDDCLRIYNSCFDGRLSFRMQYRLRRNDGAYHWIDDIGIPRFARDGTFLGYIGSCVDIHEQREAQAEQLRRLVEIAELNRQGDAAAVIAAIAHEINQPLAAIAANADAGLSYLESRTPDIDKAKAALNDIVSSAGYAGEIIRNIRNTFKNGRPAKTPVDLNDVIRDVLDLVGTELERNNVTVRTTLNEAIPLVLADRTQLQQIFVNLIKNSLEAMSSMAEARVLELATELEGSQNVIVNVRDSGTGIDPEDIERIFDQFYTTKTQGMGMGLAVCRSSVEAHDGRLWAEPAFPRGALFRISLPIKPL